MAEGDADAGKPLFKKRTRAGRHAHRVSASESLRHDPGQDEFVSVDELISLRDMFRKPTGIELTRLNAGDSKRQRRNMDTNTLKQDPSQEIESYLPTKADRHMAHGAKHDTEAPPLSPTPKEPNPAVEASTSRRNALLTSVPEVDLGLQSRLENIEATEKAKLAWIQRTLPTPSPPTDPSSLDEARRRAQHGSSPSQAPRKERASDDRVYKQFRQRVLR